MPFFYSMLVGTFYAIVKYMRSSAHNCSNLHHICKISDKDLVHFASIKNKDIDVSVILHTGYYCDNSLAPVADLGNYTCPTGHFCPVGTHRATEHPCNPGTYNNNTGLDSAAQCQECPPGFYCQDSGLSEPQGPCMAGYVSRRDHLMTQGPRNVTC